MTISNSLRFVGFTPIHIRTTYHTYSIKNMKNISRLVVLYVHLILRLVLQSPISIFIGYALHFSYMPKKPSIPTISSIDQELEGIFMNIVVGGL